MATTLQQENNVALSDGRATAIPLILNEERTSGEVIAQGAEGIVRRIVYQGRLSIHKERFAKKYRHVELDRRLTLRRLNAEARSLLRCSKAGLRVPGLYYVDMEKNAMVMEFVRGVTLRDFLKGDADDGDRFDVAKMVGGVVGKMHDADVVHGDLTTSNVIVEKVDGGKKLGLCLIDFGLSSQNGTDEDKAVDLYVLERAVISAHADKAQVINSTFWEEYRVTSRKGQQVLNRLAEVRMRGRKRDMVG